MLGIFLSRKEYDWLVVNCPAWMERRWDTYTKQWHIGGVWVRGREHEIENLQCQLDLMTSQGFQDMLGD